jgi:hypothetical protein
MGKESVQNAIARGKVKEVIAEMHGGTSGEHLRTNKTIDRFDRQIFD